MVKPVLIIQNDPNEGAGQLSTLMHDRNIRQQTVLGATTDYADLDNNEFAALVILGGAQSVCEPVEAPYVYEQIRLCERFMAANKPIAGFCLGAQVLACAVGGRVAPGEVKEIGWYDLQLTNAAAEDLLMRGHPRTLLSYHFHGDRIEEVPGCTNLASSELTSIQLFRHGSNAYGFQYHAEVDRPLLNAMCANNREYLASHGIDAHAIISESSVHLPEFERRCRAVLSAWLDLVTDAPGKPSAI